MAAIVNERDKILQAAPERIITIVIPGNQIPESLIGIKMNTDNAFFKTNAAGTVGDPTSLTFTITRTYLTAAATWSVVSGTATLTGTGDSRTLAFANMSSDTATIRATVTQNSKTYTADVRVSKVKDGANGTNGTNGSNGIDGRRGTVTLYNYSASYPPANFTTEANAVILAKTGSSTKYAGDMVTLYNNVSYSETRYWDGISSWVTGQIIDGNLLVQGTVTSYAVGTNELFGVNIDTSGRVHARGPGVNYPGTFSLIKSTGYFIQELSGGSTQYITGLAGYSDVYTGIVGYSNSAGGVGTDDKTGIGVRGVGSRAGYFTCTTSGSNANAAAVIAECANNNNYAIRAIGRMLWNGYAIPAPAGSTSTFLRNDGTWATPSTSGGVTSFNTRTGAVSLTTADVNAVGTISNNTSGSSADSAKLGGYNNTAYPRFTGNTSPSKTIAGYGEFNVSGTLVWLALYN